MRVLLIGITVGIGVSILRAPLGVELLQISGNTVGTALAFRAAGFALVALAALFMSPRFEGPRLGTQWLGGIALGFALHGMMIGWAPASHRGMIGSGLALLFVAFAIGRFSVAAAETRTDGPTRPGSAFGLALVGAGLAIAIEITARPMRWFGGGLPADDALFAICLLLPAALFASAFSRALAQPLGAAWGRLFGPQSAVLGAFAALWLLSQFGDPRRLNAHLARIGVDTSEHGTLAFDAWIALPAFAIAALGIGVLAAGVRRRDQLAALAIGACAGSLLLTHQLTDIADSTTRDVTDLARQAGIVVCLGAALATWADASSGHVRRRVLAAIPALLVVSLVPITKPVLQPAWLMVPPQALLEFDAPEGWMSVEVRGGVSVVCLDGRRLTPEREERESERRLIQAAWLGRPEGAGNRVLLLGQLGPGRAAALREVGVHEVDRCAAWSDSMSRLEQQAFAFENQSPPAGRHLSPSAARALLVAGEYDFIYAPPVYGRAPQTRQLGAPSGVPAAIAFHGGAATAARGLGKELVPVQTGLEQLDVLIFGGPHADLGGELVNAGRPMHAERPWRMLLRRVDERPRFGRELLSRRIALAGRGTPGEAETRALALQMMSQRRSSPYESPAERVEVSRDSLSAWAVAGSSDRLSRLTRSTFEDLAVLLTSKRMVEETLEFLTPVADRHWPWPALERALASAQMELLDPAAALERFGALAEEGGLDGTDWWLLAWIQAAAGDPAAAEASAARAEKLQLAAPQWEARLAEALGRAETAGPDFSPPHGGHEAHRDH